MNLGQVESKTAAEITEILNRERGVFLVNGSGTNWQITKLSNQDLPRETEQSRSAGQRS